MKLTKVTILSVLALGGVGAAIYFYNKSKKPSATAKGANLQRTDEVEILDDSIFPLEQGAEGIEVKKLQQYLNRSASCKAKTPPSHPNARMRPFLPLDEDGIFGDQTAYVLNTCYKTTSISKNTFRNMMKGLERMTNK